MAYSPIAFDPIAYDVVPSAVHIYTSNNSYWIPLKCLVEVYDNTGNTLLLSYDMFNPEANEVKLLECTVSLGLTNTQFTLKFEDGFGVINQNTIGLGNKILVYAGRSTDHLTLLFTGYSENRTPTILANHVMDYEMSGYGENAALNDLIVNFKRASSTLTEIEDPNFPKRPDSKMVVFELVKDLFEDRDVRATNDIILKNYLNLDISGISPLVTERLLSIVQSMTEVSQVLNFLTEVTGAYWKIENGKLYFEYPEVQHSGIVIKNKVASTDLAGSTSYFLGQWTYTDSISKDKGFANRIYTTTATDTKSIANSMTNKGATALFDRAIAVQVTLLETRLTTIALLLSKIGDPFTPLSESEALRGGAATNPPPPVVVCPVGYHQDSTGQCVPDVVIPPICPTGYVFNTTTQTCVPDGTITPVCPTDYTFDPITQTCLPDDSTVPPLAPVGSILVHNLVGGETRTIINIQMQQPDLTWSDYIPYNFDSGASWATDVAPEMLEAFGYGPDGVGDGGTQVEVQSKIRIQGINGEFAIPVVVQDKAHYDLFRDQPPPARYPLLRIRDITDEITMVFASTKTTLTKKGFYVPELASPAALIMLPDFQLRAGTPTTGWQWMRADFTNPSNPSETIEDWFGLNTGDDEIIMKKESVADVIGLPLVVKDECNYSSNCTLNFKEASAPVFLTNTLVEVRKESCQFARGGDPRNFGGGVAFLSKYIIIMWDLHRALVPFGFIPPPYPSLPPPTCPTGYTFNTTTQTCIPDAVVTPVCPIDYVWSESQQRCVLDTTIPPPPGTEGEYDEYGIQWLVARGEQTVVTQSRHQIEGSEIDDRWSGNNTGMRNGIESTMIAKSIGTNSSSHFASKLFGGNHSGSGASSQRWYDFGIRVGGEVQLQWEGPHPDNHTFTLPSTKQFITNIGKGLEGNWIGLKWCVQTVTPNGSPANGGVRCRMWVDTDPLDTNNRPKNNWRLCFDFIDGVDVELIDPQDYEAPDEQDCEVRRSDTDSHDVYGLGTIVTNSQEGDPGQHVRKMGTPANPPPTTCPSGYHWDTTLGRCVLDTVTPPVCPSGYHWDAGLGRCVLDTGPPPPPTQSALNISVFSDCDSGSEMDNIMDLIKSKNTHQIICCGDFTHTDAASSIDAFSAAGLDNLRINAIWCQGNHEAANEDGSSSIANEIATFFNVPTNTYCKKTRIQNVYIIGTNTNDGSFDSVGSTQYNYVLESLQEAAALKAQGTVQWIIVAGHKPHYANSGSHHMPSEDDTSNAASVYQPLFNQYGVDIVLNGHNHTFQVSEPLTLGGAELFTMSGTAYDFSKPHGQIYINDGVGGRGNYELGSINANYRYINNSNAGFVFLSLDTTGLRMTVQLITDSGTILHQFDIVKTTTTTPPPPGGQFRFNIGGDFRAGVDAENTAVNLVSDNPDVIFMLGDYAVGDASEEEWCNTIMAPVKNLGKPIWGLNGNHDNDNYLTVGFFENTQWVWSVKYGNIMFVSCDTIAENVSATQTLVAAAQADSTINRIVILMHESVFKGENGSTSGSDTTIAYHNMFKQYSKLKLVIAGHSHNWTRFTPWEGIQYIICEDGGQQPDANTGCMHCSSDTSGNITCRMITNLGVTLDTFTLTASGTVSAMRAYAPDDKNIMFLNNETGILKSNPHLVAPKSKPCVPFDCPKTVRLAKSQKDKTNVKQVHEATFSVDNKIVQSAAQLPEQVVHGEIRLDNENKPTGPVISQFKVEVGSLSSTADTIFVNDIKVDASVLSPNGKYWIVLLPVGTSNRHTVLWHHNGDMVTLDKYSAFAKGETRNDLSDWQISRYGPTYCHAIFARLRRIQEYSDPQSIQKFRLKEDIAEADFLDDSLSVAKLMQNVLAIRGKPVREYTLNEVTLPTEKWFTPGQNVTIQDDTGGHEESKNIFAEIHEVSYRWSTSESDSTIGTFKVHVLPVGTLNWHTESLYTKGE